MVTGAGAPSGSFRVFSDTWNRDSGVFSQGFTGKTAMPGYGRGKAHAVREKTVSSFRFQVRDRAQTLKVPLEYVACSPYLFRIVLIPQCG
jgi:hypothetical protein